MPDTLVFQTAYPQHSNQAPGCGFPIAKILVIFSLVTGAASRVLIDAFKNSDVTLARGCSLSRLAANSPAGPRRETTATTFGTYVDLVLVQAQLADAVFRKHQSRKSDFQRGQKLGIADHIVT